MNLIVCGKMGLGGEKAIIVKMIRVERR